MEAPVQLLIWVLIPTLVLGRLAYDSRAHARPLPKIHIVAFLFSTISATVIRHECQCIGLLEQAKGALIFALIYNLLVFSLAALVRYVGAKVVARSL